MRLFGQPARRVPVGRQLLLLFGLAVLIAACGVEPTPAAILATEAPQPSDTPTEDLQIEASATAFALTDAFTPQPPPLTRSAPTLPPSFTPTLSPTPTITPTPTPSPTATATLSAEALCERIVWPIESLDGSTVPQDSRVLLLSVQLEDGGTVRGGLLNVTLQGPTSDEPTFSQVPSEAPILLPVAQLPPGTYTYSITLTTEIYSEICPRSVTFTLLAPTPAPESTGEAVEPGTERGANLIDLIIEILRLIRGE